MSLPVTDERAFSGWSRVKVLGERTAQLGSTKKRLYIISASIITLLLLATSSPHTRRPLHYLADRTTYRQSTQQPIIAEEIIADINFSKIIVKTELAAAETRLREINSIQIQLCDKHGRPVDEVAQSNRREPSLLLHITGAEQMTIVEPRRLSWGIYEFDYRLVVPGFHELAVWFENEYLWSDTTPEDWANSADPRQTLETFGQKVANFTVDLPGKTAQELDTLLDKLPECTTADFSSDFYDGRWIDPALFSHRWQSQLSTANYTQNLIFLPDECYIRALSPREAQTCLSGKRIAAVGDSTLEELQADLGVFIGEMERFPTADEMAPYLGKVKACDTYNQKFRAFSWPVGKTILDMIWIGHHDSCWNGLGITWSNWNGLRERVRLSLASSVNVVELPSHTDTIIPEHLFAIPANAQKPDVTIINSGLHDLEAIYKDRRADFALYEERLEIIVRLALEVSGRVIIAHTNPQVTFENIAVRSLNRVMDKVAKRHSLPIIPTYVMQKSRWLNDGHVQGVSAFLLVAKKLLNFKAETTITHLELFLTDTVHLLYERTRRLC